MVQPVVCALHRELSAVVRPRFNSMLLPAQFHSALQATQEGEDGLHLLGQRQQNN